MSEKDLLAEIKRALAKKDHSWRLFLGKETLSATDVIQRLDKDKKFAKVVLKHCIGLAIEMVKKEREEHESPSSPS